MNVEELAPEAMKLSIRERSMLAAFLWESLDAPYALASEMDDDEAVALAEKRNSEIESGAVQSILHSELMDRLRG